MSAIDRYRGLAGDIAVKAPVLVATTAAITLNGVQVIDGVVVPSGSRVLVKDQADGTQNGIYDSDSGDWSRAVDFNGVGDVVQGTVAIVNQGSVGYATLWQLVTAAPVIGSSDLVFSQIFTAAGLTLVQVVNSTGLQNGPGAPLYVERATSPYDQPSNADRSLIVDGIGDEVDFSGPATVRSGLAPLTWSYVADAAGIDNSTSAVTLVAAAGAQVVNYVETAQISWDALTTATAAVIRSGAGGTVIWCGRLNVNGGFVAIDFKGKVKSAPNALLEFALLTAAGSGKKVYFSAQGWSE